MCHRRTAGERASHEILSLVEVEVEESGMAFNFNWSPLTADAAFYERARELLTTALNKAPKPPIIEADIVVSELNLGSIPPELEILEVDDLAEDRFRGIFQMRYAGDAFLTLSTRVQANPLQTYLSTRPSWTSPRPVAAATGLTIPIHITLSQIKLAACIVLGFSKQKGLKLEFRNDPLESLKISSSFDGIPFIRDYLQKQIEGQLRNLLMEDVPAIIHRLSLRLWVPDVKMGSEEMLAEEQDCDPESPSDPLNRQGNLSGLPYGLSGFKAESVQNFSQTSLLRMAVLAESQRALAMFTPTMPDATHRAWTIPVQARQAASRPTSHLFNPPSLLRMASHLPQRSATSFTTASTVSSASSAADKVSVTVPGVAAPIAAPLERDSRVPTRRKKKHRIVNLRRSKSSADVGTGLDDAMSVADTASTAPNSFSTESAELARPQPMEVSGLRTPPNPAPRFEEIEPGDRSTEFQRGRSGRIDVVDFGEEASSPYTTLRANRRPRRISLPKRNYAVLGTDRVDFPTDRTAAGSSAQEAQPEYSVVTGSAGQRSEQSEYRRPAGPESSKSASLLDFKYPLIPEAELRLGGLAERAWLMKMADEFARRADVQRVHDDDPLLLSAQHRGDRRSDNALHGGDEVDDRNDAPPAYVQTAS